MEENLEKLKELLGDVADCDECPLKIYCDFIERESFESRTICEDLGFTFLKERV